MNEHSLVIPTWSPIHLRDELKKLYWKPGTPAKKAADFWEDTLRYLYLPRLKDRGVLAQAIVKGAATRDFVGTAYGAHEGKFDGFKLGDSNVQLDDTLLLNESEAAKAYEAAHQPVVPPASSPPGPVPPGPTPGPLLPGPTPPSPIPPGPTPPPKAKLPCRIDRPPPVPRERASLMGRGRQEQQRNKVAVSLDLDTLKKSAKTNFVFRATNLVRR